MNDLIDIHCHILPYVDDGAQNREQAVEMLRMMAEQGVKTIVATPHLRPGRFETPARKVEEQLERLCAETTGVDIRLGREYFCCDAFLEMLHREPMQTLGGGRYLLVEFSPGESLPGMLGYLGEITRNGYRPLVAHAERYACLRERPQELARLTEAGAKLQLNAGSLLGENGWRVMLLCRRWVKQGAVDVIASDCHRTEERAPNLGRAAAWVERRLGRETARRLFRDNPAEILGMAAE